MKQLLARLAHGESLDEQHATELFDALFATGQDALTDGQIGAALAMLGSRRPTVDEIVGAARSMQRHMRRVSTPSSAVVVDSCGTGGSGLEAFNTSTAAGIVCAEAGLTVAKHGNRAFTSHCGSADLLEAFGVHLSGEPAEITEQLDAVRFAFLFAPFFHPATKRVQGIRRELGFRTIFNILGPLVNPASPSCQLLGVSSPELVPTMAEVLRRLGSPSALVVCGSDGLDEITLTGDTRAVRLADGRCEELVLSPEGVGLQRAAPESIRGFAVEASVVQVRELLRGGRSPHADLVMINAGALLWIAGLAPDFPAGVERVREILRSGAATERLEAIVRWSGRYRTIVE